MSLKNRKITVLIDQGNFERFEHFCNMHGCKKSTLVFKLICDFIEKEIKNKELGKGPEHEK
ncbi:hypothetical protein ACSYOV_004660 [Escherichia coli]|uniref:hypothetical protein n=1 Tax=Enterobacteriaceae TaxID=543 RepID=UPI000BE13CB1|nr:MULTISPECIES: hypothetical protein [Enterobacteriaceae]HEM7930843.1 hypothetical protein [Citrobacter braakii]EET1501984.1 CopG family transcriptional regulator [Escherichia coli]EFJ4041382.1 CopG family transcriptional regulator [Escherichia coli]EKH4493885.1 hypothetical protein [Escherichia coli]EKH4513639.1 hypothetical protein [Escherichia coli]